jgi:quercetin 2,3-dioxygenase
MKTIQKVFRNQQPHWVGDGFPVRSLFSYFSAGSAVSPFLLLDYAGPHEFAPSTQSRGVDEHPHRGFETVTIVYQGELEHRDSAGHHGGIGPGDVQWMTAASGVLHEEFHSKRFATEGGTLEMVQLWVNLPAKDKMSPPRYQEILAKQIPTVTLDGGAGTVRVIAGEFQGTKGPAKTFTPVSLWDMRLKAGRTTELVLPEGQMTALVVQRGALTVYGAETVKAVDLALFSRVGDRITIEAEEDSMALVLAGHSAGKRISSIIALCLNPKFFCHVAYFIDRSLAAFGVLCIQELPSSNPLSEKQEVMVCIPQSRWNLRSSSGSRRRNGRGVSIANHPAPVDKFQAAAKTVAQNRRRRVPRVETPSTRPAKRCARGAAASQQLPDSDKTGR